MLLDTNVLSEFMRPQPSEAVVAWLDRLPPEQVWTCAISRAEIALGHGLTLATRNVSDFEGISGLVVVNPWLMSP